MWSSKTILYLHPCHGAVQCYAVLCCAMLCCAVLCCAVLCCAVLCCAACRAVLRVVCGVGRRLREILGVLARVGVRLYLGHYGAMKDNGSVAASTQEAVWVKAGIGGREGLSDTWRRSREAERYD